MKMFKKAITVALLSSTIVTSGLSHAQEVLRMYNWSDYVATDTLKNFEKETGIRVIYDVFDSNEVLEAKLLSGRSGYDLVVPSNNFLSKQIQAGAFSTLTREMLENYGNLNPDLMRKLLSSDPENAHAVPYLWGTTGIGYNIDKVKAILGDDAPVDSLELIFNPKYVSKLAKCGVVMLDSPDEIVPQAMLYLGLDPNSHNKADLKAAGKMLAKIRPHITYFNSSRYISDLANGDVCVAYGFSGDIFQAAARAVEAKNGHVIDYSIPKEGAVLWFDMLAIPKDATNKANAHKFIDYLLKPQVIASITNYVAYANPNQAATPFVDKAVINNHSIYPPADIMANLYMKKNRPLKAQRVMTRVWNRVKSGR